MYSNPSMIPKDKARPIAIVGPTASGKSAVGLRLAQTIHAGIIACDSIQVYKGFDIGSAKPTADEQKLVPHFCIDLVTPHEPFDAQLYKEAAERSLANLNDVQQPAVIVGGTGLYLRALRFGLIPTPPQDPNLRQRLEAQNLEALQAELSAVDPQTAQGLDPHNKPRWVRALEIYHLTGQAPSKVRQEHGFKSEQVPLQIVVLQWDPELLRQRIRKRVMAMLKLGLLEEVEGLLKRGIDPKCRAMRSVGYAQALQYLRPQSIDRPRIQTYEALIDAICIATNQYAKRQRTWFRSVKGARMVPIENEDDLDRLAQSLASKEF